MVWARVVRGTSSMASTVTRARPRPRRTPPVAGWSRAMTAAPAGRSIRQRDGRCTAEHHVAPREQRGPAGIDAPRRPHSRVGKAAPHPPRLDRDLMPGGDQARTVCGTRDTRCSCGAVSRSTAMRIS